MAIEKRRGIFILLEGCDRSGKSTQCAGLTHYLRGKSLSVESLRFPNRTTTIGRIIDEYLQGKLHLSDQAIHLLFSANRWEMQKTIEELLSSGTHIVVDRYAYSGVAFSAAKGLDLQWCKNTDIGLIAPDITIFIDVSVELAKTRGGFGEEVYETVPFQQKVRGLFLQMKSSEWTAIDGSLPIDLITKEIQQHVIDAIGIHEFSPIRRDLFK